MARQYTSDAECVEALRAAAAHETQGKAASAMEVPLPTFRRWLAEAGKRGLSVDSVVLDKSAKLEIALKAAQRDLKAAVREADSAERIRTEVYNLASRSPEPPAWLVKQIKHDGVRGVPVTIWSDWHYGEVVRPEEVGGVNDFTAAIAANRIEKLVNTTIELCNEHMGKAKQSWPGIVVCLGGDMISGDIHEELVATSERTTQQCINELTDLIAAGLERLADVFGKVFVPCVVGNHGRATKKPRMKGRVYTSHEWNIYCNLERHFRKDKRINFLIPGETDAYFKVYSHRFLLTHGDSLGVAGGDGIIGAIGPIKRGTMKVGRSEAQIGRDIDTVLMGHWHQMLWLPGVIVNGALKGYDEYARLKMRAPYERPSQALFFVHPEHGITAKWEVFLDKRRETGDSSEWLTWQTTAA